MADFTKVKENLEKRGFDVTCFATREEAADYLAGRLAGRTVGHGGSVTLQELGLLDKLAGRATVVSHWNGHTHAEAAAAPVYLSSVNGLAETGEIINIDGTCNRVASTVFGHEEVYFVVGRNKLAPDYEGALWRARNIASPKNAQRLKRKTPCAAKGDKCYDCNSPERICRALVVLWEKPNGVGRCEVVLVDQDLGY
ncbi:lactate utilization protein [Pseudoflavonifractor phocaeensis]|uniref:lactate utilization protein n=1 Tax=Pseudoflavonifractor phocaeensis TaxID=1870988 RepID=UPI00195CB1F7|nr:lactate utilization protein [Pseudoflavonifractor phocaeensis]MBM6925682.1 lactate utilization protein [Pseudoflavonifractor phocaeensis]